MHRVLIFRPLLVTLVQMAYHPNRKFLGLTILYCIIIFGIFLLQFRSESSILQNFGTIHLQLSQTSVQSGSQQPEPTLKNSFQVSSTGMILFSSESTPLLLQTENEKTIPLVLQDWTKNSKDSFSLLFSENVSLDFLSSKDQFDISASLPTETSSLTIPYKTTDSYTVTDILRNRIVFKSKDGAQSLQAGEITENTIIFSSTLGTLAQVTTFKETAAFSFDSIIGHTNASPTTLDLLSEQMRSKLVNDYPSVQHGALNENFVAAYVAELAFQGNYNEGLSNIPTSFIESTKRTYFTAPYFDTLALMNQSFVLEKESIASSMQFSIDRGVLDVFERDEFLSFLLQQKPSDIAPILSLPASLNVFEPTISQATGILTIYTNLFALQPASAVLLEPVLEKCLAFIETSCILTEASLSLVSEGAPVDKVLAVKTGKALFDYGKITSRVDLQEGGTLLIVSVLQNTTALDPSTMASIYPYIAENNPYYPHGNVLAYENGNPVWAWNISTDLSYSKDANGTISIDMEFPVDEIHHMIITGIEPFTEIQIYDLPYNSDPNFEIWDSPGYVYIAETKTLLLKYRQRDLVERLRLFYNVPQQ